MFGPIEYKQYKLWYESEAEALTFPGQHTGPSSATARAYFQVWGTDDRAVLELECEVTAEAAAELWGRKDVEQVAVEEGKRMAQQIIDARGPLRPRDDVVPRFRWRIEKI